MKGFYLKLYIGFLCMVKAILPKEKNPENFAVAIIAGAATFLYFTITVFFLKRSASGMETAGMYFILYAAHYYLLLRNEKNEHTITETSCSNQLIYRSVLYFITTLSLLMFVSSKVAGS